MSEARLNVHKFILIVFNEGVISTLYGVPGSGKTNLAVVFMQMLVERGYHVYTNINFFDYKQVGEAINKGYLKRGIHYRKRPDEIHIILTVSELLMGLLTTEKNVVILDESGIFASSLNPRAKNVRTLKELAFIIRHLSASLMLLAQSKGSIIPDLRSTLTEIELRIKKLGMGDARVLSVATAVQATNDLGEEETRFEVADGDEYYGIPPTVYPFDSKFLPAFKLDINLTEALERLAKLNTIDVREQGAKIVSDLKEETERKGEKKKESKRKERDPLINERLKIFYETHPDATIREAAKECGTTYNYARKVHFEISGF